MHLRYRLGYHPVRTATGGDSHSGSSYSEQREPTLPTYPRWNGREEALQSSLIPDLCDISPRRGSYETRRGRVPGPTESLQRDPALHNS